MQRASLVNKDQVYDHLKSLNIFNSMGPGETHPRVLNELGDAVSKPLFIIFEKLWQPGEDKVSGKRETLYPSLKMAERNYGPVSLTSVHWKNHGTDLPGICAETHGEQGGD